MIDLEREWPTRVHLIARASGAAARGGSVTLVREGSAQPLEQHSYLYGLRSVKTTALGEREEWVAPGKYHLVASGRGWRWTSSATFEIEVTAPRGTLQAAITRKVETDVYGRPLPGWRAKALGPVLASHEWGAPDAAETAKPRDILIPRAVDK